MGSAPAAEIAVGPNVRLMLDLSTNHLPEEIGAYRLNRVDGLVVTELPHGWLMWVPDDPDDSASASEEPVPDVVLNIQRYARERGCDFVLFDSDAPTCDDLPTWEW